MESVFPCFSGTYLCDEVKTEFEGCSIVTCNDFKEIDCLHISHSECVRANKMFVYTVAVYECYLRCSN